MVIGGNQRENKGNTILLLHFVSFKNLNLKVSFIKIRPIYMLLIKPKIGAKLIYFYEIRKFYTRVYAHIINRCSVFHKKRHIQ